MVLAKITWSDGDSFTADFSLEALQWYIDNGISIEIVPEQEQQPEPVPVPQTETLSSQDPVNETTQEPQTQVLPIFISMGFFQIMDDRIRGAVEFGAFQFEGSAVAIMTVKDMNKVDLITPKQNNLHFTTAESDERISYSEFVGTANEVEIKIVVWKSLSDPTPLAPFKRQIVKRDEPLPEQPPFLPPVTGPSGPSIKVEGTSIGKIISGVFMVGVLAAVIKGFKK